MAAASQWALRGTVVLACVGWAGTALAQDEPVVRDRGIALDAWLGGGATSAIKESGTQGTLALGLTGLYRRRWLELGLGYRREGALFEFTADIPGALAGVTMDPAPWLRFDLLAEGGAYVVSNVGRDLFATSLSGGTAALPYVGGRAGVAFLLFTGPTHSRFLLGWWVNAGDTVGATTLAPVVNHCFFGCAASSDTFTFGGPSWSTGLRFGGDIGFQ